MLKLFSTLPSAFQNCKCWKCVTIITFPWNVLGFFYEYKQMLNETWKLVDILRIYGNWEDLSIYCLYKHFCLHNPNSRPNCSKACNLKMKAEIVPAKWIKHIPFDSDALVGLDLLFSLIVCDLLKLFKPHFRY